MNKHTPGPWLIQKSTVYALNDRRPQVNRFSASVDAGFDNCDKSISRKEVSANTLLIAAAPDLLEALESSVADLFYQMEMRHGPEIASKYPSIVAGRSAIAKAKGLA